MPITFQEVVSAFEALELSVEQSKDYPGIGSLKFDMPSYVDSDGDKEALVVFSISPDGHSVDLAVGECYSLAHCRYKAATFLALLQANAQSQHASFEIDEAAEGVDLVASVTVADGSLHLTQLQAVVIDLLSTLNTFHPVIVHAMEKGEVDLARRWEPAQEEPAERPQFDPALLAEVGKLVEKSGGRDGFEQLVQAFMAEERKS